MEASCLPISTPKSIISSYQPSEVPFELPSSNEASPKEDEITYIPISVPQLCDHDTRTYLPYSLRFGIPSTTVTHKDIRWLSDAGVRGSISTVCHGTFHSQPATLILFTFIFRSGYHGFRFQNANVKINFSNHHSSTSASRPGTEPNEASNPSPSVVKLAPRKIYGLPTIEGRKQRIGGEVSLQVPIPLGTLTVGPSATYDRESSFDISHRYSMVGNFWSSKRDSGWDVAYWNIRENRRTKQGIPDRVNVGVVVKRKRDVAFSADVKVTVDTPILNGVFGFPWSRERPVGFVPGVEIGVEGVRTRRFEALEDEDWRGLIPWEEEWEDLVTGHVGVEETPPGYMKD